ncbi:MAG: hypothetical protein NZX77_10835 [Polyangiaceae bacterium]|nr:hypothetical protein [Polyangiaceae bacterium]
MQPTPTPPIPPVAPTIPQKKPRTLLLVSLIILLWFLGLPLEMILFMVFPGLIRLPLAPLLCPSDTKHSALEVWWSGNTRGGQSMRWELYCIDAQGFGFNPPTWQQVLTLLLCGAAIFMMAFVTLLFHLRKLNKS